MTDVLTKQACTASALYDMVGLKFGPNEFLLYYQTAFKIAAGILMSAKEAARYEGVHPSIWSKQLKMEQQVPLTKKHWEYRRTTATPNFRDWKIGGERNLVVFTFDHEAIKMHYSDAFTLYKMVRVAAKNAKAWAGDSSRQWTTRAVLHGAEENDKFTYVT